MRRAGLPVAHQGHLVQIPCHQVSDVYKRQPLYLDKVRGVLEQAGVNVDSVILPDGEQYKSLAEFAPAGAKKVGIISVSYTHLDVYKRQDLHGDILADHGRVDAAGDLEVDEDADLAARMDVLVLCQSFADNLPLLIRNLFSQRKYF